MKTKKVLAVCLSVWAACVLLSSFDNVEMKIPEDTSAIEEYIESRSNMEIGSCYEQKEAY